MTWLFAATANLKRSKEFYSNLEFKALDESKQWFTEGNLLLQLASDTKARSGIKIYSEKWQAILNHLKSKQEILEYNNGFCTTDPNGVWFYFEKEKPLVDYNITSSFSLAGSFAGISIEVIDMTQSADWLDHIGFTIETDKREQGWLSMKNNDGFGISLLKAGNCPHAFINPSLTFFNSGKNPSIIQKIKEKNIPILEEITCFNPESIADNVVLQDPAGPGIFIFND